MRGARRGTGLAILGALGAAILGALGAAIPAVAGAQAPAAPGPAPPPGVIAPGVSIAGVAVGGLSAADARAAVIAQHVVPRRTTLVVTFRGRNLAIDPVKAGYVARVRYAVQVALLYGRSKPLPGTGAVTVPLRETVNTKKLRAILSARAVRNDLPARDASVRLRGVTPVFGKPRIGTAIDVPRSATRVAAAITARDRASYPLVTSRTIPARRSVGPVIVIDRDAFRLTWYRGKRTLSFPIAVGQSAYPTPTGDFSVIIKQRNPTWYPPSSPWAAGIGPVPPGVGNPLGTRWIGISAPAIGIHGTPVPSSIGTRASHGCIRMYMDDVERLYELVDIGTPVYIR